MSPPEHTEAIIHNDEPTSEDRLNREQYAEAFARLAETCGTPLVVGLYATWGVGKTSLMKLIETKLDTEKVHTIWFDPWQHQFDENPVVALAHTLVDSLDSEVKKEGKKILTTIAAAFGSALLKSTIGLNADDILKLGKIYEEERFQIRDTRVRFREHFETLIAKVKGDGERSKRLVFFIDDLDRCMPDEALKVIEALKLYLNIQGCIYFLGVDRHALEQSIKHRYKDLVIEGVDYLDKIIQLPFQIPLIEAKCMDVFIEPLLSEDLQSCRALLVDGLEDNPRQVKRFVNTLTLNHQLAKALNIPDYNPTVLSLLILIQLIIPKLYRRISLQPDLLIKFKQQAEEAKEIFDEFLATKDRIRNIINQVDLPDEENLKIYIYLTKTASVSEKDSLKVSYIDIQKTLFEHKEWIDTKGDKGNKANFQGVNLNGADLNRANLEGADLFMANLKKANLRQANLNGANLKLAYLLEADLQGANLLEANLHRANLAFAKIYKADLRKANATMADFSQANLTEANLIGAALQLADLNEVNLSRANLSRANLSRANLSKANLSRADLSGANLEGANLEGADLKGANLKGANLKGANLREANLFDSALGGANFTDADLSHANLYDVFLVGADLKGANLVEADLRLDSYTKAAFTDERALRETLCEAKSLFMAKLDHSIKRLIKEDCPDLLAAPKDSPERGKEKENGI